VATSRCWDESCVQEEMRGLRVGCGGGRAHERWVVCVAKSNREAASQRLRPDTLAARLREVSEATLAVTSELDLDRALQKVVDSARELVNARYGALGVARPDLSGLSRFIVSGMEPEQIAAIGEWPRGLGLLGALLREPRPLRLKNIAEDPRSVGFPPHHPPMRSFLGVPIRWGDRILGNFYMADKVGAEEFSQEDEDILVLFASHAAVAIENARRFTETRDRLSRSLLEVQRAERRSRFLAELSGLLPIGPIVAQMPWQKVAERATELLGDGCVIYLVDPDNPEVVRSRVVQHRDPARAEASRRFIDASWKTILDQVIGQRRSLFVARLETGLLARGPLDPTLMEREKISAAIIVPIKTERRVYGMFASLASVPTTFSEDDLTFGALVAERLGIALENAELIRDLRAALESRDEFISIATHELKTPIAVLRGYAQLLQAEEGVGAGPRRQALAAMEGQTRRLSDLINELLDVSRLRLGRLELRAERFDLVDLCREVVERFALLTPAGQLPRVRLEARDASLWGEWDRGRIDQVLTNLVSNALKYSPQGGDVVVEVQRRGDEAMVSVSDQGIGIPAEEQARIFEPFRRATNARLRRIEGAGLGLHISKEIVERHGGQMWFTSEEGKGSTFYFTLPLVRLGESPPPPQASPGTRGWTS